MMNKLMKKIAVAFAAATMALTATSAVSLANDGMGIDSMSGVSCSEYDATMYVVASSGANVRTAPSTNGTLITSLSYGQKVTVCGQTSNGWYQLIVTDPTYGGQTAGYVAGNLLSGTQPSSGSSSSSTSSTRTVSVATGYLALRTACTYDDSNIIGRLYTGDTVQYINTASNGYAYVYAYVYAPTLNMYGYVNASYIH